MRLFALGLLIGTLILQQFRHLPNVEAIGIIVVAFLLPWRQPACRFLAALIIGCCWSLVWASSSLDHRLAKSFESQPLRVQGRIIGLPQYHGDKLQFYLRPISMHKEKDSVLLVEAEHLPRKIKLSWFHSREKLQSGEFVDFTVKLKRPNGFMNPAGFDYETWLFANGVDAVGYVKQRHPIAELANSKQFGDLLDSLRQSVYGKLRNSVVGFDNAGLIAALVVGERSNITTAQWRLLQNTGTNHLLAISGLHIGLVATMMFFVARRLWSRLNLTQLLPAQRAAALAALLAALAYASLAGFSIPTQRAVIMVSVILLAQWRQRPMLPSQGLASALVLVILLNPLNVLQMGFWLSFLAVASLMYSLSARQRGLGTIRRWLLPQVAVFLGLSLFLLHQFGQIPVLSPLANVVAIPWVSFITVPLSLSSLPFLWLSPTLAHALLALSDLSLSALQHFLAWLDSAQWLLHIPLGDSLWPWLSAGGGLLLLLLPSGVPLRAAALCLFLPLLFQSPRHLNDGQFRVTFFDVGQGLAVLVATRSHVMVYDSGPRFGKNFDAAQAVILPMLRQMGYSKIDRLLLSHHDIDHMGASDSLLRHYTVDQVLTTWVDSERGLVNNCKENQHWSWDQVEFTILHPPDGFSTTESDNNHSCVIRVSSAGHRLLLTGDIETKVEKALLRRYGVSDLRADVLLVPHHGSKSSSSTAFIDSVSPNWAVASCGYRNRFGFPKPKIVERYLQRGIAFLGTSHYGALTFLFDGLAGPRLIHAERLDESRYWHRDSTPPSSKGFRNQPRSGQED